jgi:hypothetical protein
MFYKTLHCSSSAASHESANRASHDVLLESVLSHFSVLCNAVSGLLKVPPFLSECKAFLFQDFMQVYSERFSRLNLYEY